MLTAIGLVVPCKGVSPFRGRFLEIAEACVLPTPIPVCLAVLDPHQSIRALIS
ncbi:hypothetical protein [Streptomyces sp. NPDC102437]|uniref:hypothetical protein n=1 Tax=Streptomyces sp. NPDC102437 TaxID=3366175 RepID=UPI0038204626